MLVRACACVRSALRQRVLRVGELSEKGAGIEGSGREEGEREGVRMGMIMLP